MNWKENWKEEIEELHAVFQAYFRGSEPSLDRVESALEPRFTIVGPNGVVSDREATLAALGAARGQATNLKITTTDHQLIFETSTHLVASYVEHHRSPASQSRRSTVVFSVDSEGPNGLRWLRVHETWITTD